MTRGFRKQKGLSNSKARLKRQRAPEISDNGGFEKKRRPLKDELPPSPSPSGSGESSSEELSDIASEQEEEVVYKEPSTYDNLLNQLKSGTDYRDSVNERRQRHGEYERASKDDVDGGSESHSMSEGEDNDDIIKAEASENEYDQASGTDEEHESGVGQDAVGASVITSLYNVHFGCNLSKGEVVSLETRKLKYRWELPAFDMSNCKWTGTGECFLKDVDKGFGYGLKPKLYNHWFDVYNRSGGTDFDSSLRRHFFSLCNGYRDILHCNKKPFYLKGQEEDSSVMDAYIMHSLNHVFRTRDLVTKNDAKISKLQESAKEEILAGDGFRDHGFTRPKVLILLPLASIAFRVVKRLLQLIPPAHKVNVEHLDHFSKKFGNDNEDEEIEKSHSSSKPSDHEALFSGNSNDHFIMGIKFTRKSIKLYSDFYSSDIIIASPLGLITKIAEAASEKEKKDVDYLSSIEVLIIDHADVIAMQNWSHVDTVIQHFNRVPLKQHGTNVMRIRPWYLEGYVRFYRQTIILGSYLFPDMNALFNHQCHNFQGKVKLLCEYKGVLPKVLLEVRQIYERFDAASIVDIDDARLEYFAKKVYPKIKDSIQGGIMLFISSYFEFVRVRNFLKSQNASFCLLGEYTNDRDISRARVWFFKGKRKIMLYTERAHFYRRFKIRGVQNLIMYSLPERKEIYPEIVNMLQGSNNMTCSVLFSRFDKLRLERIVGTAVAKRMLTSEKGVFAFC